MGKLALVGLGTALGTTLGVLGVLVGQRSGFLPPPETPGDPWAATPRSDRAAFDPQVAEEPIGIVSTATPGAAGAGPTASSAEQDDLVRCLRVGDVAELLGTTTARLEKDYDLPEPDAPVGQSRGWLESTIERWLGARQAREGGRST